MVPRLPILIVALAFSLLPATNAAIFPKKSRVKHINAEEFQAAIDREHTFVTAFVASWSGLCQRLVPELTRTAEGLHPLLPVYAVDCVDDQNKALCEEQEIKDFPTIKLYPQGTRMKPLEFDGIPNANSFFYWASRAVPSNMTRSQTAEGVRKLVKQNPDKVSAVLMNKSNKSPLLWRVAANRYGDRLNFINCRDRKGKESEKFGFEAGDKSQKHKILIFGIGETEPIRYEAAMNFATLSEFFDQILEGKIDVSRAAYDAKQIAFKAPEVTEGLVDETAMDEKGYGGFDPHGGMSLDDLMELTGGVNPHAAGHPGTDGHQSVLKSSSEADAAEMASKAEL